MKKNDGRETKRNLTLAPYRPADFETLYRIDQGCYEPGIAYSRRVLGSFLALPESSCWVARHEEEIVGFVLAAWEAPRGHLITLDVAESARRLGVGSALLARTEAEMSRNGVDQVELETARDNSAAIAFWTRHGYRILAVYPRYYLNRIDAFLMTKCLSPLAAGTD